MSFWSRIANVFRGERLNREFDEELESHLEEAVANGCDAREAWQALGSVTKQRDSSHDTHVLVWLDRLRADVIFGWRQLKRNRVTSLAAVLSLAVAMGACVSAFRLIDALFLRPLPVSEPGQLYVVFFQGFGLGGAPYSYDSCSYPMFRRWRAAVKNEAELIAVSYAERADLTFGSDDRMEKAYRQNVSGWMFSSFGLKPALGRLLSEADDLEPGQHPVAVLSYDYWQHRFGRDPKVIGRTFHLGGNLYEIVGVASKGFTGTEPGTMTDIFLPTMMEAGSIHSENSFWLRVLIHAKPGTANGPLRDKMAAIYVAAERERAKTFKNFPKELLTGYPKDKLEIVPAAQGISGMQRDYGSALAVLGVLVLLVLLIACANVANLMTALGSARSREMALRVSIGAGRGRLMQMVLVESAMLALFASATGALFAWWSAPFVVSRINPPDNPARLILSADWRVFGFGVALICGATLLFGFLPAIRASSVRPISALKGGDEPYGRRRLMHGLIALQVAFCFVVLFITGLFVTTLHRLSTQATGFSAERLLLLDTAAQQPQSPIVWQQAADQLRTISGVDAVAIAQWPLMSGTMSNNFISIHPAPPGNVLAFFLGVSPDWLNVMKIPLIAGRNFRASDTSPRVAIVNQAFVKQFFSGVEPIGKSFGAGGKTYEIVGVAGDAIYRNIREPILPQVYRPFRSSAADGTLEPAGSAVFIVRTAGQNPLALAPTLRREVARTSTGLRVSNIRTQLEIIAAQTVRERLLAALALFFTCVALLLAAVGLYGVLNYSVLQRRREIGIRVAIGARRAAITKLLTADLLAMVAMGAAGGVSLGLASVRSIESLLFGVKANDPRMFVLPMLAVFVTAFVATLPAVSRALRIDPAEILRSE